MNSNATLFTPSLAAFRFRAAGTIRGDVISSVLLYTKLDVTGGGSIPFGEPFRLPRCGSEIVAKGAVSSVALVVGRCCGASILEVDRNTYFRFKIVFTGIDPLGPARDS